MVMSVLGLSLLYSNKELTLSRYCDWDGSSLYLFVSGVTTVTVAQILDADVTIGLVLDSDVMIGVTVG
jgi:hypothetical protein